MIVSRPCRKCGNIFDTMVCKACVRERAKKWYWEHRERSLSASRKWRKQNIERKKAYDAAWNSTHKERARANKSAWYAAHRSDPKIIAMRKRNEVVWRAAHLEERKIKEQNRRARKISSRGVLSKDIAEKLFKLQRGICACGCAQRLGENYHLDHIMPLALGGGHEDVNMQLLRDRCNISKGAKHPIKFMQERGFLL